MIAIRPLTRRQAEILDYLSAFIGQHGYGPSLEEIGRRFGLTSLATVHKHLENLKTKGYLDRAWNRSRSMTLRFHGKFCPTCGRAFIKEQVMTDQIDETPEPERKTVEDAAAQPPTEAPQEDAETGSAKGE